MSDFDTTRPVFYERGSERRLLFYDVFRGLGGKLCVLAPLVAVDWVGALDDHPTFSESRPPTPLLAMPGRPGFIHGVFVDQRQMHLFYGSRLIYPTVTRFHWHAITFEFDISAADGDTIDLYFTETNSGKQRRIEFTIPETPVEHHNFAVETLFRNDNDLLPQWLAHSRSIGFTRFYLYDNLSETAPENLGEDVTLVPWPYPYFHRVPAGYEDSDNHDSSVLGLAGPVPSQMHALYKYGAHCEWMAFFDDDEYLNLLQHDSVAEFLAGDSERASVVVGSLFFGPADPAEPDFKRRHLRREEPKESNGFGYGQKKQILHIPRLLPGEHVGVHEFVSARNPELWSVRGAFTTDSRRQAALDEARLNHYYTLSSKRRLQGGGVATETHDDTILRR